jgi:hypothetical protein
MLMSSIFHVRTTVSSPKNGGTNSAPATPRRRSKTPTKNVPFRIPDETSVSSQNGKTYTLIISNNTPPKNIRTTSSSSATPPSTPSPALEKDVSRSKSDSFSYDYSLSMSRENTEVSPKIFRSGSFTHVRCLNCNQQFIVNTKSPASDASLRGNMTDEFCSGECRCSFLATGIDQQYHYNARASLSTFVLNSSDEDMNLDDDDDNWD